MTILITYHTISFLTGGLPATIRLGQETCGTCGGIVTLVRDGTLRRISYYCGACQRPPPGAPWAAEERAAAADPPTTTASSGGSSSRSGPSDGDGGELTPDGDDCVPALMMPPTCPCGRAPKLQRVRKAGPTHQRLFWSCAGRKQCKCVASTPLTLVRAAS
jgi:hypothetical protein